MSIIPTTKAIQDEINRVGDMGGGTVEVAGGECKLTDIITFRPNIILVCLFNWLLKPRLMN